MGPRSGPIVALLLLAGTNAAWTGPPTRSKPVPVPPLNARVAEFARDHVGRPVGDGICVTLAIEALRAAGARAEPPFDPAGDYVWGEPVPDFADVLPGDVLQFRDAEFAGSRPTRAGRLTWHESYPHHTAVVVATAERGRLISICHQNVRREGDDPAAVGRVREATLRMDALRPGGRVRAYRPVATPVASARPGADVP